MNDLEFEILIKILLNLVNPYAIYMLYGAILKEKKFNNKITFFSYALFYFLTTFIYLFVNIPLFVILSNLLGFLLLTFIYKEENFEELNSHIQSIIGEFSIMEIFKDSGVLELDSILNVKFSEGEKIGIDFQKKITKISNEIVNGLDLAVIVGNLLDNAIEATSKVSSKWIDIKIKEVYEVVYISIENSFDGVLKEKDGRLLTRKSNERRHGMGLRNVQTIIKKYDGDMKITYTPATFKVSIILYKTQNSQYFG